MEEKSTQMRILVTGATGFIGQHLVRSLASQPDRFSVYAFVRSTSNTDYLPEDVTAREGELLKPDTLASVMRNIDVVIHLAAVMDFYPNDVKGLYRVNVEGTTNLLNAFIAERQNHHSYPTRFIYISSTETMGAVEQLPGDENTPLNPVYDYGISKVMAEKAVTDVATKAGLPFVILRPTGVLGPGDFFSIYELMHMVNRGLLCFIPGSGSAELMYTHVEDVVQGIVKSIVSEKCLNEIIILCPDAPLTYKEWIIHLCALLGRSKPFIHLPFVIVKLATAMMGPIMNLGKKRLFMFKVDTVDRMSEHRSYTNAKAKKLLDYHPKYSLREAITQTVKYNVQKGYIHRYNYSPVMTCLVVLLAILLLLYLVWK